MKITLKDGSVKEYAEKMSVLQIATDISEGLGRAACAGKVNGKVVDLRDEVSEDCELEILTFRDGQCPVREHAPVPWQSAWQNAAFPSSSRFPFSPCTASA